MGYFANGIVFTSPPDFDAASKVVPGRLARGYKHNQHPVWLLDLWKPRGKLQLRQAPFCDPAAHGFRTDLAGVDAATGAFLTALERLQQTIDIRNAEVSCVHLALAVAGATRGPTFFFAADDDETDMGCNAVPGALVSFACRLDRLSVQYVRGQTTVTPLNYQDDEEGLEEMIMAAKSVAGISVLEPLDIEGSQLFYENPVAQWPQPAGDPAELLGLGTWDPLLNIEDDYTVVFEKLGP